ncbi:hypothetical protein [Thauera sp.]|uniref:hypothetical protein n=1 Tax=Thauera sp. TaxID=1905334 RepID=UPI002B8702F7|nr:hypothetical protein [Thauera sp.]HRP25941.1 hypothetical protein [Thauera sp.]
MSISQTNIPKATQVTITVDGTAFQDQTTAINPSGGEFGVNTLTAINGDTFTQTGDKSARSFEFTSIYTDGEASDLWPVLDGKHGDDVVIVYKPKGAGSGTTFTLTGLLYRLDIPAVSSDANSMSYTWAVSGNVVVS